MPWHGVQCVRMIPALRISTTFALVIMAAGQIIAMPYGASLPPGLFAALFIIIFVFWCALFAPLFTTGRRINDPV